MIGLCVVFFSFLSLYCAKCDKAIAIDGAAFCKKGCAIENDLKCKKCTAVSDKDDCDLSDYGHFGCQWKKKCKPSSCPVIAKKMKNIIKNNEGHVSFDDKQHDHIKKVCETYGCLYSKKKESCSGLSLWALILIIDIIAVVLVITVVAIIVMIVLKTERTPDKIEAEQMEKIELNQISPEPRTPPSVGSSNTPPDGLSNTPTVIGPYLVVKVGAQNQRTKMVKNCPKLEWGETLVFENLGNEDDDAVFELWDQETESQLGSALERLLSYRERTRVSLTLENSIGVAVGTLEVDIELNVNEEKDPLEISVEISVDKFNKAILQ